MCTPTTPVFYSPQHVPATFLSRESPCKAHVNVECIVEEAGTTTTPVVHSPQHVSATSVSRESPCKCEML